ncbi:MAG: cysteine desulfurase [Chitinophagaceae bacterium]
MNGTAWDIATIRKDFPLLDEKVYGKPLVYLDNAATTQKPLSVLNTLEEYYRRYNSNVHRGVHLLSQEATEAYEVARRKIAHFINAASDKEIIFTKGTTDGINLVANCFGRGFLKQGDVVLISAMEHHSNIVPWQITCEEHGAEVKVISIQENGELDMDAFDQLIDTPNLRFLSITFVSNTLGTVNPIKEIVAKAHQRNIPVLVDAAQAVQHQPVDVQDLDAEFIVLSGHKMYGPTGIGCLYGKSEWLDKLPPYQGGGDMIKEVTFAKTTYNVIPFKFEAGTPDISGAIALGAAVDYITSVGIDNIQKWEHDLIQYAVEQLRNIPNIRFIGDATNRSGAVSFLVGNIHPFDLGELLDKQGIAVRTGHHCTQPLMDIYGIPGTVRASFALYNTRAEIDQLVAGVRKAAGILA